MGKVKKQSGDAGSGQIRYTVGKIGYDFDIISEILNFPSSERINEAF
jgi:hypothetical protein